MLTYLLQCLSGNWSNLYRKTITGRKEFVTRGECTLRVNSKNSRPVIML